MAVIDGLLHKTAAGEADTFTPTSGTKTICGNFVVTKKTSNGVVVEFQNIAGQKRWDFNTANGEISFFESNGNIGGTIGSSGANLFLDGSIFGGDIQVRPAVGKQFEMLRGFHAIPTSTKTIATGAITATDMFTVVEPESGVADTLSTINGDIAGSLLFLQGATANITIDDTGNISPLGGSVILTPGSVLQFRFDGSNWKQITPVAAANNIKRVKAIDDTDSPYTVVAGDQLLEVDTTSGNVTINLPAIASSLGRQLTVNKRIAANTITVDGNASETINGATTDTLTSQYENKNYCGLSTEWGIV